MAFYTRKELMDRAKKYGEVERTSEVSAREEMNDYEKGLMQ
jgi:hypothetical protein